MKFPLKDQSQERWASGLVDFGSVGFIVALGLGVASASFPIQDHAIMCNGGLGLFSLLGRFTVVGLGGQAPKTP